MFKNNLFITIKKVNLSRNHKIEYLTQITSFDF